MNQSEAQSSSFENLGIAANFLAILKRLNFSTPTPIQHQAIPIAMEGKDIIGIAQTGTGKTLAFGVPMIQRIAVLKAKGLVILPTRELALQVEEVLHKVGSALGLRTAVLIGGAPMPKQLQALRKNPHIVIATPGRLIDHMEQRTIDIGTMTIAVLDEADRMLDMGFQPQMKRILEKLPKERQIMLFSATMPREIVALATKHMKLPLQIEVAPAGTLADRVEQEFFIVRNEEKIRLLDTLINQYRGTILIFSRTKHGAKKICRAINAMGHAAAEIHSNRSLAQRRQALDGFKSGRYRVLVATDIAARGIDVQNIELVVNYDLPADAGDYVHRIGRTGRAGKAGRAISFVAPDQRGELRDIERLTRTRLSVAQTPVLAPARPLPARQAYTGGPARSRPAQTRAPMGHGRARFGGRGRDITSQSADDRSGGGSQRPGRAQFSASGSARQPERPLFEPKEFNEDTQTPNDKFFSRPKPRRAYNSPGRGQRGGSGRR